MSRFKINPDIRLAETLPSEFYTSDGIFKESKKKIFARTWQVSAVASTVDNVKPVVLLPGFLDEPLALTRIGGSIACVSNVCTHRGKIVVEDECRANGLRCGYHGRRFDLAGRFLSMPEFEQTLNFPTERDDLARVPCEDWQDLAFVSLEPAASIDVFLADVRRIASGLYSGPLRFAAADDYEVNAHWALYCENYLEGFHIPYVHSGLNRAIDYGSYRTETFRFSSLQVAAADSPEISATFAGGIAAYYFFVFPNLMLNYYPWGVSVNVVKPVRSDLTRVSYLTFVADESKRETGAGADLETVEFEDQAVVESVQRGIRSRFYDRGRYSPTREQGTHHFHRLIAEFMDR
ncbi:MAG: Rieske 2Fe-2S domain-containing protein [Acidobacteria bacterium]|nr:Rieske 2Fe-2S domain-containing protein [Acidobacteriota bacterium]